MPTVTEGSSVTLTVDERDLVYVIVDNAIVRYENPPGQFSALIYSDTYLGPLSAGQIKLTANYRSFEYETGASAPLGPEETKLLAWAYAESFRFKSATRNSDGAITTATVVWPDGTTGTYTTDTLSADFAGAIDAWHLTYDSDPVKTVTQPLVTRNANGDVINQPAITIR